MCGELCILKCRIANDFTSMAGFIVLSRELFKHFYFGGGSHRAIMAVNFCFVFVFVFLLYNYGQ